MEGQVAADLKHRFGFHPARGSRGAEHEEIRDACLQAAYVIAGKCPPGREQSLAFTKLEEAMMWGNAGLARSPQVE